ncbi:hypothetical protein [Cupriavidus sp. D39]|uniref:hypothetical protein n=1 Tax=Cupriavidus sp. D39 TaxID=2997877 RepID=UPI0022703F63|nr:hypothetical protein [Cupriavidus sp. D39]MCY0858093.1 hypothetical protein [Cupriavidus sp. D39]
MKDIDGIERVLEELKPHWAAIEDDFNKHNARYLELAKADHDAIGRVLRSHLVIENFLDRYLEGHLGITDLAELRLTFAQKAKLLPAKQASAATVRPGIIQLNRIRNRFGHSLDPSIPQQDVSAMEELLRLARPGVAFPTAVDVIEAFAPVACAFLSVPPPQLQELFARAFMHVQSYSHE